MIRTFKIDTDKYLDWTIEFTFFDGKKATATSLPEGGAMRVEFFGIEDLTSKAWIFSGRRGIQDSFVTDFITLNYADWASGSRDTLSAKMVEITAKDTEDTDENERLPGSSNSPATDDDARAFRKIFSMRGIFCTANHRRC